MATYQISVSREFIDQLRAKYGVVGGDLVIPPDFPEGIERLVVNTHIILEHATEKDHPLPGYRLAKQRMAAITEYLEELRRLQLSNLLSQPQPSYPSR